MGPDQTSSSGPFSLAILGGGINGVAIARDAAQRGLRVILFEKNDFGSGASSKSSKLVHGGLRYLSSLSFGLVQESLRESALLLANAPHLVKPLPFLLPVYRGDRFPLWLTRLGISLYDRLKSKSQLHQNLSPQQIAQLLPNLTSSGLKGGCLYYDAQMQDNRLVIENMLSAEREGAILLNYTQVTQISKENGLFCLSTSAGNFSAKCLVNATGAWSNITSTSLQLPTVLSTYPTKGVHLVLPQIEPHRALALTVPQDGRLFFLIPWMGYSLLGTTDTPFSADPETVDVSPEDIHYLLTALRHYFPSVDEKIIASFAGLRPLVNLKEGPLAPSRISREHRYHLSPDGIITILGGKYTTYRHIAEEGVDLALQYLKIKAPHCRTRETPLYGAQDNLWPTLSDAELHSQAEKLQLPLAQLKRLSQQYGAATDQILEFIRNDPQERQQICSHHPHLFAELSYAIDKEKARCPDDWFQRRTSIAYTPCHGLHCLEAVSNRFTRHQ